MFVRRLVTVPLAIAALCFTSLAAAPASAQQNTPAPCANPTLVNIYTAATSAWAGADPTKPSSLGTTLLALLPLRYQAEDLAPVAGCEAAQTALIQVITTEEDEIYLTAAGQVDTANASQYNTLGGNTLGRLKALNGVMPSLFVASAANTTPAAAATAAATAPAPQACSDAGFIAQVKADIASLNGGTANAIPFINLRYKYEDLVAPNGCEAGRLAFIQTLAITEDSAALSTVAQLDTANASAYTDFLSKNLGARGAANNKLMTGAFPSLAPTQAATASS